MDRRLTIGSIAAVLVILCVSAASATEALQAVLPLSVPFACLNCHLTGTPTAANASLNDFGRAFLDNGSVWNRYLASLDSDGDGCTNGAELGDVDGNGQPDGSVTQESSNPGAAGDCSASTIDASTWGELKAMFTGR
ncbi:MAG: hypothetical protein Q7W56_13095 [Candidatus Latescibacteria bacterium]|nr:hypothetical protein [Candidatus Latescibacterota bacterium]